MRLFLYSEDEFLEEKLMFHLKSISQSIITFFDLDDNITKHTAIFICKKWDDSYLKNVEKNVKVCVLTTNLESVTEKNILLVKIKPLEYIISNWKKTRNISEKFNFSITHEVLELFKKMIEDNIFGTYYLINTGSVYGKDLVNFYSLNIETNYLEENISPVFISSGLSCIYDFYDLSKKNKVNIYIPVYYRFRKAKNCILSIIEYSKKSNYDIKIYVGDNNTKLEEMNSWLKSLDIDVYFSNKNIGKAMMVNYLHSKARACDYVFSIDGDMVCPNKEYNVFDGMINCLEKGENIGLISSFQYEQSEHWFNGTINVIKSNNIKLGVSESGIGIAGGCVVLRKTDWDKIKGYKEDHDIYTGDDGILTYKVYRILNKICAISMDFGLIHPKHSEDEQGYLEWKRQSWQRDKLNFLKDDYKGKNTKGYYD